jgi:hypothetical protein
MRCYGAAESARCWQRVTPAGVTAAQQPYDLAAKSYDRVMPKISFKNLMEDYSDADQ